MNPASLLLLLWLQTTAQAARPPSSDWLALPSYADTLVVTDSREERRLTDAVSSITTLPREELAQSPALTLDEQLRQVPGFSLLRRSSSLSAHPTSQGVSLRGLGPSGASRTLVLFDGTPLNDPFGGWVYWNRLPPAALESVEVARGSLSQLYGSAAMGGAIQLLARTPKQKRTFEANLRLGDHRTGDAEVFAAGSAQDGARQGSVVGRHFDTDGFYVLSPENRGAVDRRANVGFDSFYGRFQWQGYHAGWNAFREERGNGTALQTNETRLQTLDAGYGGERWQWDLYGQSQRFESTFSRILADRSQEFLTAVQDVRVDAFGGSASWRSGGGFLVGGDLRRASWNPRQQTLGGLYSQKVARVTSRLDLIAGARLDLWQASSTRSSFNPRLGLLLRASDAVTLRVSAYRGFRTPTLNELYRPFRVGNVETEANPALREETLLGAEIGADFSPNSRTFFRANAFRNRLDGAIGNVTLSATPQLITRRRQNLDRVEVDGLETEARFRPFARWQLQASYLYSDSRVERTGLRVPQVPRQQGSMGVSWDGPLRVSLSGRGATSQFEDDQNLLALPSFFVFDLSLRLPLRDRFEIFLAAENLLNEKVVTGRTPLENLGAPRLVQVGVKMRLRRD
ncbi:MAG: TonB-dependent receptor [Acidobacteriota bacterium]